MHRDKESDDTYLILPVTLPSDFNLVIFKQGEKPGTGTEAARYDFDKNDPATYYYARQAMHRMLYTIANSKSMNGAMPGSHIKDGLRKSELIMIVVSVIFTLLIILEIYKIFRLFKPTAKKLAKLQAKAEKKARK